MRQQPREVLLDPLGIRPAELRLELRPGLPLGVGHAALAPELGGGEPVEEVRVLAHRHVVVRGEVLAPLEALEAVGAQLLAERTLGPHLLMEQEAVPAQARHHPGDRGRRDAQLAGHLAKARARLQPPEHPGQQVGPAHPVGGAKGLVREAPPARQAAVALDEVRGALALEEADLLETPTLPVPQVEGTGRIGTERGRLGGKRRGHAERLDHPGDNTQSCGHKLQPNRGIPRMHEGPGAVGARAGVGSSVLVTASSVDDAHELPLQLRLAHGQAREVDARRRFLAGSVPAVPGQALHARSRRALDRRDLAAPHVEDPHADRGRGALRQGDRGDLELERRVVAARVREHVAEGEAEGDAVVHAGRGTCRDVELAVAPLAVRHRARVRIAAGAGAQDGSGRRWGVSVGFCSSSNAIAPVVWAFATLVPLFMKCTPSGSL